MTSEALAYSPFCWEPIWKPSPVINVDFSILHCSSCWVYKLIITHVEDRKGLCCAILVQSIGSFDFELASSWIFTSVNRTGSTKVKLYNCIVRLGFLPWEIRVAFPGESQLRHSRATQPTVHAGCLSVSINHQTLTWTTGFLTCAHMLMHAVAHGGVRTP